MNRTLLLPILAIALGFSAPYCAAETNSNAPQAVQEKALGILSNSELSAYHGWIKYLMARTQLDAERFGEASEQALAAKTRLAEWTARIEADPNVIYTLRGPTEWAYLSEADGSGQPFQVNIPTDYDPQHPFPLSMYAHGYSGNHMEFAQYKPLQGTFELSILGRARGGFYTGLSEVDVLDALAYVREHWNIDPLRIHINGGSMGGWACFRYGSRHPDIWASARPACGFGMALPLSNMVDLPVYSTHSDDDPVVPIIEERGPIYRLKELGGMIISDDTTGYGHAVWDYAEGNARGEEWEKRQTARKAEEVRRIDYTATDGLATGAWWAKIARWGNEQAAARFVTRAQPDNTLYIRAENIAELDLFLANSPIDRNKNLHISVNSGLFFTVSAPLPEKLRLCENGGTWAPCPCKETGERLHTPGGWTQVYDGSPILIVYGTQGNAEENAALKAAAIAASKSPNCSWPVDKGDPSQIDGVSHLQNLYGNLPIMADSELDEADIARCNLVLIGTAEQNAIVKRIADKLPVRMDREEITTDKGNKISAKGSAVALVYKNPEAPQNVILWLASFDSSFYAAGAKLPKLLQNRGLGVDFAVTGADDSRIFAAGSFDSGWNWSASDNTPLCEEIADSRDLGRMIADAYMKATNADFGVSPGRTSLALFPSFALEPVKGVTKLADVALFYYADPVYQLKLSGAELKKLADDSAKSELRVLEFSSNFEANSLDDDALYSIAYISESSDPISDLGCLPQVSEWTGVMANDAILRYGK
ncbi:MAG: hypothetical protein JW942_09285 [Opitutales bacterium]|nr:hypothetical protein [Opitutales bacterium]